MVKSLSADEVIDYKKQDYTTLSHDSDIVFDAVGKTSKTVARKILKDSGVFVLVNMLTSERIEDLLVIKQMAEAGKLKPFVDKTYSLDQIVEAKKYVDSGRKRGNVMIAVN